MVKDWAYMAAFQRNDLPSLYQMVQEIQQTHNTDIIEDFNDKCEQYIKGKNPELRIGDKTISFEQVVKSDDLVVIVGLEQTIRIILGTSVTRWQYMGLGTGGATAATTAQTALVTESGLGRIDMALSGRGWREPVGMKLFFGAIGNELATTSTYTEMGVFNTPTSTIMLNRNAFPNNGLAHTVSKSVSILSSVIEFCPVV